MLVRLVGSEKGIRDSHLAGIMLYFISLVALVLSWMFLDEQFTFLQGVGFIVTVLSVYFLNRKYSEE